MILNPSPLEIAKLLFAILVTALGLFVLARMWRSSSAVAFALYAISGGMLSSADVLTQWGSAAWVALEIPALLVGIVGTALLMAVFPSRLEPRQMRAVGAFAALGFVLTLAWNGANQAITGYDQWMTFGVNKAIIGTNRWVFVGTTHGPAVLAFILLNTLGFSLFFLLLVLLPWRVLRLPPEDSSRARSLAIIGIGSALGTAGNAGAILDVARGTGTFVDAVMLGLFLLGPIVGWIVATRGAHARLARTVVLLHLGIFGLAALLFLANNQAAWTLGAAASTVLLGYAVLRGQMHGLDLKVRFAIKTSTVAAIFLAVLFIVANIAQNFLGGQYGVVVGGAAAGLLFFAMAPIQRAAERLAERAVPAVAPASAPLGGFNQREASYRDAVQFALRDRRLSRAEEVKLHGLAEQLGIGAKRAHEILVQAESETGVP